MGPGRIRTGDYSDYAGQRFGLRDIDFLDFGVGLGAEQRLAVEHVRQCQIVAVDYLSGDLFVRVDARYRFADDS